MEDLPDASILGKLLVLPANVRLDWKVIATYKHSSLSSDTKEKSFERWHLEVAVVETVVGGDVVRVPLFVVFRRTILAAEHPRLPGFKNSEKKIKKVFFSFVVVAFGAVGDTDKTETSDWEGETFGICGKSYKTFFLSFLLEK